MSNTKETPISEEGELARLQEVYYKVDPMFSFTTGTYPGLLSLDCADSASWEEIYWGKHRKEYVDRLKNLIEVVTPERRIEAAEADVIITIPMRNELNPQVAIDAVKAGCSKQSGALKYFIIFYHNHEEQTKSLPEDILEAVGRLEGLPQVVVIDECVGGSMKMQDAKKVALDLALKLKDSARNVPIVAMDADIVGMSNGCIADSIALLSSSEERVRLVSSDYFYDPSLRVKFPAIYEYLLLKRLIKKFWYAELQAKEAEELNDNKSSHLHGGYVVGFSDVFAKLGGIIPIQSIFEDILLTHQLRQAAQILGYSGLPYINIYYHGHQVLVDPSREVEDIVNNSPGGVYAHWNMAGIDEYSGKRRFLWKIFLNSREDDLLKLWRRNERNRMLLVVIEQIFEREGFLEGFGIVEPKRVLDDDHHEVDIATEINKVALLHIVAFIEYYLSTCNSEIHIRELASTLLNLHYRVKASLEKASGQGQHQFEGFIPFSIEKAREDILLKRVPIKANLFDSLLAEYNRVLRRDLRQKEKDEERRGATLKKRKERAITFRRR